MFTSLLVPLDGSQLAESVLPIVKTLAERLHCTVKLIHVIEKRPPARSMETLICRTSREPSATWLQSRMF